MNANPNRAVRVYCVDLAKRKFQVHGYSDAGACAYRRTLSREAFEKLFRQVSGTEALVVMESCASDGALGIGCITATAVVGTVGERVERFADARQFAASLGVTPQENSSGETRRLGGITKRGDPYLRKLLVQCAQSIVNACQRRDDAICQFARRLLDRRPRNTVVIAVANRLARIIYAMIKHGTDYQPAHASN